MIWIDLLILAVLVTAIVLAWRAWPAAVQEPREEGVPQYVVDLHRQQVELLEGIAAQLTSDTGLSLRDAIDRLEVAGKQQYEASEFLKDGVRDDRHKAELDREQLQRLLVELFRLTIKMEASIATGVRIEMATDAARHVAQSVADDLSAAHARADAIGAGNHGAAADAAAQQTDKEKLREIETEEG
jgi:ABC-type sugar transport system substrate-binding protein